MKTYTFQVALAPDGAGWHIYVPELESMGASTWGLTQVDAFNHIREVLEMIIEEFEEEGKSIPTAKFMPDSEDLAVTVTV